MSTSLMSNKMINLILVLLVVILLILSIVYITQGSNQILNWDPSKIFDGE